MINMKLSCPGLFLRLVMRTKVISIAPFIHNQPYVLQPFYWVGVLRCKNVLRELQGSKFLVLLVSVKHSNPTPQVSLFCSLANQTLLLQFLGSRLILSMGLHRVGHDWSDLAAAAYQTWAEEDKKCFSSCHRGFLLGPEWTLRTFH